jgi:hypothetical protein
VESKDKKGALAYYLKAMAFRMDAMSYEGEYTGKFMHLIKANGKGKITLHTGKAIQGTFIDGKLLESGEIEIFYPDKSIYKGTWRDTILEGQGNLTFASGVSLDSVFQNSSSVGKAKVTKFEKLSIKG